MTTKPAPHILKEVGQTITNDKTIKALAIECRKAVGMTYVGDELVIEEYMRKAIDAHEGWLVTEVDRLRAELTKARAERDAALRLVMEQLQ